MVSLKDYQLNSQDFFKPINIELDSAAPTQTGIDVNVGQPANVNTGTGNNRRPVDTLTRPNKYNIGLDPIWDYKKIDLDKVYDFDAEQAKLNGGDSSGPWADPKKIAGALGSAGLAVGFAGQTLGSTLGIGSILNAKAGVPNPVTGKNTVSLIPFLDNLIMKERYDAMKEIQTYVSSGQGTDAYDIFRLGTQTFIRKPGSYRFIGNVSALGIDHGDLHKIVAVSQGQDPRDYDYKSGKSSRSDILTYGNGLAGGYTLDGGHVDNRGIFASAGGGHSDEFKMMAYKFFNGKNIGREKAHEIAQAWLTSTADLRKSSFFGGQSYNATEQAALQANFNKFVAMSKGTFQNSNVFNESGYPLANQPVTSSTFDQGAADSITDAQSEDYSEAVVDAGYDFGAFDTYNDESQGRKQFLSALQTGTGDPEPSSFVKDFTDPPNYQRYTGGDPMYDQPPSKNTTPKGTTPKGFGGGSKYDSLGPHPDRYDFLNNDTPITDFAGGLDTTWFDVVRSTVASGLNKIGDAAQNSLALSLPVMAIKEADKAGLSGGIVGIMASPTEKQKFDNYFGFDNDDDKEDNTGKTFDSNFRPQASITQNQADQIKEANKEAGFTSNLRGGFRQGGLIPMQDGGQPQLVGGVMPQQVSEQATVADDQPRQVAEKSFVVNAPAVEKVILNPDAINVAGVQDVRKMVIDAYTFAKQKGMSIGDVDRGLYEESVDVALSKGELVIPPDLVKIIGKDRLEKINNRGKKEVTRRAEASGQENAEGLQLGQYIQEGFSSAMQGAGKVLQDLIPNTLGQFSQEEKPSLKMSDDVNFLNTPTPVKGGQPKVVIQNEGFASPSLNNDSPQDIPYYNLFEKLESNKGAGYVPRYQSGRPFEKSGVTIGVGVDLSKQTASKLMKYEVDPEVIEKLKPYMGKEKIAGKAIKLLDKKALTLDTDEIAHLNSQVVNGYLKDFERIYPEFKDINDRDKGFMFAAFYHGSLKGYKSFREDYLETQSIPTALKTGLYNLISKDGPDRNRLDKALTWWNSQSETPETPLSKPKM